MQKITTRLSGEFVKAYPKKDRYSVGGRWHYKEWHDIEVSPHERKIMLSKKVKSPLAGKKLINVIEVKKVEVKNKEVKK